VLEAERNKFLARLMMSASEGEAAGQPGSGDPSELGQQLPVSGLSAVSPCGSACIIE
jgi:hypothetical protein